MNIDNKYKCIPFWSWNDELDEKMLVEQIDWMHSKGVGGFFMHARSGLSTEYLSPKWFSCIEACEKRALELGMECYAYDENGWPSGFAGGKLLEDENNRDCYLTTSQGKYDPKSLCAFDISGDKAIKVTSGEDVFNIYLNISTSTADICNKDVVKKFINLTHEEYKKHDIYHNLRGFFTDEPQYYRWGVSYTHELEKYFVENYGENVLDRLALLFVDKDGYRDFRYKYWKAMQNLMLNSFAKQIYDWCESNNYLLTGHYVEETSLGYQMVCCGGIMPFYEYEHIPGCDWLGRDIAGNDLAPKQVSSVAAQLGKQQTLCEMFACVGWDCTPLEYKHIADYLYVSGINLMCQHLLPYSEHGNRKRDYPEHWSNVNPWIEKGFNQFNEHYDKLGEKLSNSIEYATVGVLQPIRSCYFVYQRYQDAFGCRDLDLSLHGVMYKLNAKHIPYHFLDETIMAKHAHVDKDTLVVGNCRYKYIVLPLTYTMDTTTEKLLHEFVLNGGKIIIDGDKPTYLEGQKYSYDYLNTNCSYDEIIETLPFECEENENVTIAYRVDKDNQPFVFAVNLSDKKVDCKFKFKNYPSSCDGDKVFTNKISLNKYGSLVLTPTTEIAPSNKALKSLKLSNEFRLVKPVDNFLTLDFVQYSFDGQNYSEQLHHMGVFMEMLNKRYKGDLYLKYHFMIDDLPSKCIALIEDTNTIEVQINGNKVEHFGPTKIEYMLFKYDVFKYLKNGDNEIVVKINYYQSEDVYECWFGENIQESKKNCLVYPTTIEPIYLMGDFGVTGDFEQGKQDNILLGDKFVITKQNDKISSLIKDGFPFFRGDIELSQQINVDDVNAKLVIDERFHLIDLFVNGNHVDLMMFDVEIDLSKYLKIGLNDIKIVLTVSNRNLLGPFHTENQEDIGVGPHTFERVGTWKDGKSSILKEKYSFIKTII